VRVNRVVREEERAADVPLRHSLGQVAEHFELALGQLASALDAAVGRSERAGDLLELQADSSGVVAVRKEETSLLDEAAR